jgi:hypothetical protein
MVFPLSAEESPEQPVKASTPVAARATATLIVVFIALSSLSCAAPLRSRLNG